LTDCSAGFACPTFLLGHAQRQPLHKIALKSVHKLLINPASQQTEKHTDKSHHRASFYGGIITVITRSLIMFILLSLWRSHYESMMRYILMHTERRRAAPYTLRPNQHKLVVGCYGLHPTVRFTSVLPSLKTRNISALL